MEKKIYNMEELLAYLQKAKDTKPNMFKNLEWEEDLTRGYLKVSRATIFGRTNLSFVISKCRDGQLRMFDNYYLDCTNLDKYSNEIDSVEDGMNLAQERFNEHCYEILNNIFG